MKNIQAVKIGNTVNVSIDGKLQKKNCATPEESNELFKAVLKAKDNPTDENIRAIHMLLNEKTRIAMRAGLEGDPESGEIFLAGFNTPIPDTLVEVIKEYYENNYPMDAIINFWKLLMINPDKRVRTSLFDFIKIHDFVLTDAGYMVVYKAVDRKDVNNDAQAFEEYVSNQYLHVRKDWKCNPNKYAVYKNLDDDTYGISKVETVEGWDGNERGVDVLGKLGELYEDIFNATDRVNNDTTPVYLSKYSGAPKMEIKLGVPVVMDRKECDSDPAIDCSFGLHVGATAYVARFCGSSGAVLACYVNPANVVAVPDYDHSKMRVSEYFPFAVATYENSKIDIIEQAYFESDYVDYEINELNELIGYVQNNELPIETAINAEQEVRPMSELLQILETRLIDIE